MSLIEDESLDADLEDLPEELPRFMDGRPGIAEVLKGQSPYGRYPTYWAGAVFAFLARLRYEGVNRPPGTDKPSVESYYSANARVVQDICNKLPDLAKKSAAHLRYLQRTKKGKYNVRRAQFDELWSTLSTDELKGEITGTARMAFDCGAANCRMFLRKEARDLHQFYANRRGEAVPATTAGATV